MSSALLLLLSAAVVAQAQTFGGTCAGGSVPDVAALQSQYPRLGAVADILPGDSAALQLFRSINGTALAARPNTLTRDGDVDMRHYDQDRDPLCWWSVTNCDTSRLPNIPPDAHTCPTPATWGLSFDDGPTCAHAPLYTLLKQNNQQASLFYIGSNVASYPQEARLGFNQGHEICVHTWSHHYLTTLTNSQIFAELYYTKMIIKQLLGVTPRCWRPPYGDVDDRVRTIATALELAAFLWSDDTNDWMAAETGLAEPQADYAKILGAKYTRAGTMVLTHEVDALTVNLFLQHWQNIKSAFKNVVSAASCMNITAPYAEATAPLSQNMAQYLANGPVLATQQAPSTMSGSATPFFGGQVAFLASLNGTNIAPVVPAPSLSSALGAPSTMPLASSVAGSPSASAGATLQGANGAVSSPNAAILGGAIGGGVALVLLIALLFFVARRRGWLCFDTDEADRRRRAERYATIGSPRLDDVASEKGRPSAAFLREAEADDDDHKSIYAPTSRYPSQASLVVPTTEDPSARHASVSVTTPPLMAGEWAPRSYVVDSWESRRRGGLF